MSPSTPATPAELEAMEIALSEARAAASHGDVPVGAVVLMGGKIVSARHNERELSGDPTAHAELLAIREAAALAGGWRLDDASLVVTLEPCLMCAGAALLARVRKLVFGAFDPKAGACGSLYNLCCDPRLNHEIAVTSGVAEGDCSEMLGAFFEGRRGRGPEGGVAT